MSREQGGRAAFWLLLVICVLGAAVWYRTQMQGPSAEKLGNTAQAPSEASNLPPEPATDPGQSASEEPALDEPQASVDAGPVLGLPNPLPEVDQSDSLVRDVVAVLSEHPEVARALAPGDLVRTAVVSVVNVSEGKSPAKHLRHLQPKGSFEVRSGDTGVSIDPASYKRYDGLAAAVASVDVRSAVRLYRGLKPLFQDAYAELGYPDEDFDDAVQGAIDRLLQAPVVASDVTVARDVITYTYVDPELEGLDPASRQFLRMGPKNVELVQAKLRAFRGALSKSVE